ncbi:MAG: AraC family transcriptional regulator, partial [Pseudomonadota bacterium]
RPGHLGVATGAMRLHGARDPMLHHELLRRLCLARDWLREDTEPRPSVSAVARRAAIAPHHFIRLFKAVFGETPHQYRSLAQIERAKHLLILTDQSVTEVCMAVGFSSLGSFSVLFTRRVGLSPSAFQRRYRPAAGSSRQLPPELVPGCLSLMAGFPAEKAISKKRRSRKPGKLAAIPS